MIGIGEDGIDGLAAEPRRRIAQAALVVGGARHLALAAPLIRGETLAWPSPLRAAYPAILARRGAPVAVLASGDPNWFGIATALARLVPAAERLCLPAPSAFALACARLDWPLQEVATISFCGRPLDAVLPLLQPGARILALSADAATPAALAALLDRHGFADTRLMVLEALGGPRERVRAGIGPQIDGPEIAGPGIAGPGIAGPGIAGPGIDGPEIDGPGIDGPGIDGPGIDPLNLVALEVGSLGRVVPLAAGLADRLFAHDGQLTKQEIRAVTLAALAPRRGEMLWDIGSGSGSVAIEWMLRHPACRAIAIERRADRAARIGANAAALGVPGLAVVEGCAPAALAGLAPPDAVFIGGGAHDPAVTAAAWAALPPGGRLVINAVTLETEAALIALHGTIGGRLRRLSVERLEPVGGLHAYRPAMTVTQFTAERP